MVFKRDDGQPSKGQLNAMTLLSKRRSSFGKITSRKSSNSLCSQSSSSLTKWNRLDNPLVSLTLKGRFKFDQNFQFKKKEKHHRRRRRRESSKETEGSTDIANVENEDDNDISGSEVDRNGDADSQRGDSLFESFSDLDLDEHYLLHTKGGEEVKVKFGHDYISIDSQLILYEHVIYWSHTNRCLKLSYVENMSTSEQDRVEISLYPRKKDRISAAALASVLQAKVAQLYKELTGCSEVEAIDVASKQAAKSQVVEVLNHVDQNSELRFAEGFTQDI